MADLVDDDLLALAADDVAGAVAGTFLQGRPAIPVASPTGHGIDAVRAALAALRPRARSSSGGFRLPVDRAFVRPGFGTVVTGTAASGRVAVDAVVRIEPGGRAVRVRGIQAHARHAAEAVAGRRVALNLGGVDVADLPRGAVVVDGPVAVTQVADLWLTVTSPEPLADGLQVRFLSGTSEHIGRLFVAAEGATIEPGAPLPAQIRLDAPAVLWPGDRFVVRRASPLETLGGGEVVDPWAPRLRPRDRAAHGLAAAALKAGDHSIWLLRAGPGGLPRADALSRGVADLGVSLGDRVLSVPDAAAHHEALIERLGAFHRDHPLEPGAGRRELRAGRLAALPDRSWEDLLARAEQRGEVVAEGAVIRLSAFAIRLGPEAAATRAAVEALFATAGPGGADAADLARAMPGLDTGPYVRMLEGAGLIVAVPGIGWASATALDRVRSDVRAWFAMHDALRPADFKELTGLARKGAIPLLEWLDRQRLTRRQGDVRVAGSAISGGAAPP
jgi:selenocysteine-specific elongation factor